MEEKSNFRKGLERVLVSGIIGIGSLVGNLDAGRLGVYNRSNDVSWSMMEAKQIYNSLEGRDGEDVDYNSGNPNVLHIYSINNNCDPNTLMVDARGENSTTSFNLDLYKNGTSGDADNFLRFRMYDDTNFQWKNLFLGDKNNSNNIIADIKHVIASDGRTYSSDGTPYGDFYIDDIDGTTTGVYDTRTIFIFNHADINRDGKVNLADYAILSQNWGREGIDKGSDPNALGDYADISGNGSVGVEDLATFSQEWLWDANDSSTW